MERYSLTSVDMLVNMFDNAKFDPKAGDKPMEFEIGEVVIVAVNPYGSDYFGFMRGKEHLLRLKSDNRSEYDLQRVEELSLLEAAMAEARPITIRGRLGKTSTGDLILRVYGLDYASGKIKTHGFDHHPE